MKYAIWYLFFILIVPRIVIAHDPPKDNSRVLHYSSTSGYIDRLDSVRNSALQAPVVPYIPQVEKLENVIRREFSPKMVAIIKCESGFRQFKHGTTTLISPTRDVGVMQINLKTWHKKSKEMGLDIFGSTEDNITMGKYILKVQGESAWTCSKKV